MLGAKLLAMFGSSAGGVVLADASVFGVRYARWTIGTDGFTYEQSGSGAATKDGTWISPQIGMGKYQVRATSTGADLPPGTMGVWLPIGQTWGWSNVSSAKDGALLIEIRRISDSVVVKSATVKLTVAGLE